MSDIWSGKFTNWHRSYSDKTPINVLQRKQQELLRRHELVYQMLKMRQAKIDLAVAAYPSAKSPFRYDESTTMSTEAPWVAINASPDTYSWILGGVARNSAEYQGSLKSKRDAELLELLRRCHKDVERIAAIIQSRKGTPAAAAASEEYL